jgi:hypothetical protein
MHNQITQHQVFRFKHQVIRDLAWSLWGPALLIHDTPYAETVNNERANSDRFFPLDEQWLQQLDQQPQVLITYLEEKNTRLLGAYFEALWQFYFSHHQRFKQCICNLQINDDSRTVGEFDVLVTTQEEQNFHIELTCKFYLEWQDSLQETLWIGPNCGDRLDFKYHKTDTHQLPLLNTELGQKSYQQQALNTHEVQQLAIWRGTPFPSNHWFKAQELASDGVLTAWRSHNDILWFIAEKSLWLSPVIQPRESLKTYHQVCQQVDHHFQYENDNKRHYTLMLIALAFNEENQQWQQQQQFFITPNNWPYGKLADSALTPLRPCKPPVCINR